MAAILFGSIGTIVETSELQREAFNRAFEDHDLDWNWSRTEYRELLTNSGGADRIETYAKSRNQKVDARAIHLSKSERFQQMLRNTPLRPREGVSDVIRSSKTNGFKIAFVTTTLRANLDALFESVRSHILKSDFDLVTDASLIQCPKPAGDVYDYALQSLAEDHTTKVFFWFVCVPLCLHLQNTTHCIGHSAMLHQETYSQNCALLVTTLCCVATTTLLFQELLQIILACWNLIFQLL